MIIGLNSDVIIGKFKVRVININILTFSVYQNNKL